MLKKVLCLALIASIMSVSGPMVLATESKAEEAVTTEKAKAAIAKLGTGPSAQVEVTLQDKSKLKGYILASDEEHFVLVREKTGVTHEVAYPQIKKVKGNNLSTGVKVAIGVGIGIAILIAVFKDHIMAY